MVMDNKQEGQTVVELSNGSDGPVRPSVQEAKETAGRLGRLGDASGKRGPGVQAGAKRGPYTKGKDGKIQSNNPPAPPPPPFIWDKKDVALILSSPFTFAYAVGGPDHEHWKIASTQLDGGQCYDKMVYVVNRLGITDPLYLVLAVGIMEYLGVIGSCAAKSVGIRRNKVAQKEAAEKNKNVGVGD